jgi:hypothetical protein
LAFDNQVADALIKGPLKSGPPHQQALQQVRRRHRKHRPDVDALLAGDGGLPRASACLWLALIAAWRRDSRNRPKRRKGALDPTSVS